MKLADHRPRDVKASAYAHCFVSKTKNGRFRSELRLCHSYPSFVLLFSALHCSRLCAAQPHPTHRPKKKVLDALDALSDDSDASSSGSSDNEHEEEQKPAKKQKTEISLEDLQKQGYNSGPSVLYMKPPEEAAQHNWAW